MIFPYIVNLDGVYYPAGTDVPCEGAKSVADDPTPLRDEEITFETNAVSTDAPSKRGRRKVGKR